jgi:undecaprenyl-diphosphatase
MRRAVPILHSDSGTAAAPKPRAAGFPLGARTIVSILVLAAVMVGLGFLVTHSFAHSWPFNAEDGVDRTLAAHRDRALNSATSALSTAANTIGTVIAAAVACLVAGLVSRHWRAAAFIASGLAIEVGVFLLTTVLVHRSRPIGLQLDHSPPTSSFPSGHSAAAVALYGALAWLLARGARRPYAWLLLLVPVAVGFSRLYRGMHHPSDVVAGFLLGAGALLIANRAVLRPASARSSSRSASTKPVVTR